MNKKLSTQGGFTLIELLVVIMVLTTIGVVVSNIVSVSLRGANKVNTLTSARQNGDYAVSQMAKVLRFAKSLDALNGGSIAGCAVATVPTPNPSPTPFPYSSVTVTLLDNTQTTFACTGTTITQTTTTDPTLPTPTPASLLDNSVSVVPGSCSFTCYQQYALDSPKIGIKFTLSQPPVPNVTLVPEKTTLVPFDTSIILRNVVR